MAEVVIRIAWNIMHPENIVFSLHSYWHSIDSEELHPSLLLSSCYYVFRHVSHLVLGCSVTTNARNWLSLLGSIELDWVWFSYLVFYWFVIGFPVHGPIGDGKHVQVQSDTETEENGKFSVASLSCILRSWSVESDMYYSIWWHQAREYSKYSHIYYGHTWAK